MPRHRDGSSQSSIHGTGRRTTLDGHSGHGRIVRYLRCPCTRESIRVWALTQLVCERKDKLHLINLPPVAYVFGKGKPNDWVQAKTHADGLRLHLHTIHSDHPQSDQLVELVW